MLSINAQVEDEETERLLTYLEDRLGKNRMDQLDLLSCARQWLELEDKIPTAFSPYVPREKQSALSVAGDCEDVPAVSSLSQTPSLQPPA
jgi:hypothetical protein